MESETRETPAHEPPNGAFSVQQRLHPSSLFFVIAGHIKRLIIPGIFVLLFAKGDDWEAWLMILFVPFAIYGVFHYLTVRYRFAPDEIVVTAGILNRNERHIPFARIQNIDFVQNIFHRMVGVAEVRLETASGTEPEAIFTVLSVEAIDEMRARVFGGVRAGETSAAEAPAEGTGTPIARVGGGDLVRLGLIVNRGMAMVAAVIGLAWQFDVFEEISVLDWIDPLFADATTAAFIFLAALLAFGVLILLFLLSIAWTLIRFWGFELVSVGDDLRISCGLLTRISATIPRRRIQFVSVHESVVHRLFGRVTLRVETAGGGDGDESETNLSRKWFVPLLPAAEVPRVLEAVQPKVAMSDVDWQPLAPGARRRMLIRDLLGALVVTAIACAVVRPWGALIGALVVPLAVWGAFREARYAGWAWVPEGIVYRSGAFTRRISATLFAKVQSASVHRSPFDRRWGMGSVHVDTAGAGPAGHKIHVPYLHDHVAQEVKATLTRRAEGTGFLW